MGYTYPGINLVKWRNNTIREQTVNSRWQYLNPSDRYEAPKTITRSTKTNIETSTKQKPTNK